LNNASRKRLISTVVLPALARPPMYDTLPGGKSRPLNDYARE
jgi:hypothetical protein